MTVCVAAITREMVVGASDRMLSTGEIAFEPQTPKIQVVTNAIFAMTAGDAALQAQLISAVRQDVNALVNRPDARWLTVQEVAHLYVSHWQGLKRATAERHFLWPLGLNGSSFINQQQSLAPSVAERLTNDLINYRLPRTACIVAGVDPSGPHIWTVEDGEPSCEDGVSFACIGSGARHANSQLMLGGHGRQRSSVETITLVHLAKKRAEVSPGVGSQTDMFMLGPMLGQQSFLTQQMLNELDQNVENLRRAEAAAQAAATEQFSSYVTKLMSAPPETQQSDEVTAPGEPPPK